MDLTNGSRSVPRYGSISLRSVYESAASLISGVGSPTNYCAATRLFTYSVCSLRCLCLHRHGISMYIYPWIHAWIWICYSNRLECWNSIYAWRIFDLVSFSVVCKQPCSDMSWEVSGEVPYNRKRVPFHSSLNVSAWRSGTARSLFSLLVCYAWKQGGEKLSFFLGNPVCDKFLYKVSHVEMPYP